MVPYFLSRLISGIRRRFRTDESGFTIVELMVASGIILSALSVLAYTATVGFTDVAMARQRQGATALGNETLEKMRALPIEVFRTGHSTTDLQASTTVGNAAFDPAITATGSPAVYRFGGEVLVHGTQPASDPLAPHARTRTVGSTTYQIKTYVTNSPDAGVYRGTAVVSWSNAARKGSANLTKVQSLYYFAEGCQGTTTHPFSAPCTASLFTKAATGPGGITISGTIDGEPFQAQLSLPQQDATIELEQVQAAAGLARTNGGSITGTTPIGGQLVTSSSNNNPTLNRPVYDVQSLTQSGAAVRRVGSLGNGLRLRTGSEAAKATSTIKADSTARPCPNAAGTQQVDQLPCSRVETDQTGELRAILLLGGDPDDETNTQRATLASIGSSKSVNYVNRDVTVQSGGMCATLSATPSDGCVHASTQREFGTIGIGALPPVDALSGFDFLIKITPPRTDCPSCSTFADNVLAEAGRGTANPSWQVTRGTLSFWHGSGYTNVDLTNLDAFTSATSQINRPGTTISANITRGNRFTSSVPGTCSGCVRASAQARSGSPFLAQVQYKRTGVDLTISVDLGAIGADATYAPAP